MFVVKFLMRSLPSHLQLTIFLRVGQSCCLVARSFRLQLPQESLSHTFQGSLQLYRHWPYLLKHAVPISLSVPIAYCFRELLIETQAGSIFQRFRSSVASSPCGLNQRMRKTPRQTKEHRLRARAGQVAEDRWKSAQAVQSAKSAMDSRSLLWAAGPPSLARIHSTTRDSTDHHPSHLWRSARWKFGRSARQTLQS